MVDDAWNSPNNWENFSFQNWLFVRSQMFIKRSQRSLLTEDEECIFSFPLCTHDQQGNFCNSGRSFGILKN